MIKILEIDTLNMVNYVMRFACIHFHGFMKIGTFACIRIRVLSITDTLGYCKSNFQGVNNFADNEET